MIVIGIDCGVNTGVSVWCQESKEITYFDSMMIHRALAIVELRKDEVALVRVEDARKAYKSSKYTTESDNAKKQGVGSVKRDSKIWDDFLSDLNIPYELVKPTKAATYKATKKSPERMHLFHRIFPKIPRLTTVSEDHIRDATHLCYGIGKSYTKYFQK